MATDTSGDYLEQYYKAKQLEYAQKHPEYRPLLKFSNDLEAIARFLQWFLR